tara:strand:- start:1433 stop:1618 length:186 start_codon:yes stop_codon:yes gene_type:complete
MLKIITKNEQWIKKSGNALAWLIYNILMVSNYSFWCSDRSLLTSMGLGAQKALISNPVHAP